MAKICRVIFEQHIGKPYLNGFDVVYDSGAIRSFSDYSKYVTNIDDTYVLPKTVQAWLKTRPITREWDEHIRKYDRAKHTWIKADAIETHYTVWEEQE